MDFDLIIVGSGLAGSSLAVALCSSALRIAVVEAAAPAPLPGAGWDPRIYAISPTNQRFLADIGIWQHLNPARLSPVREMEIRGDQGAKLSFSAYDCGASELAWIVESGLMACEFWETIKRQSNVTLFCPETPVTLDIQPDLARMGLASGKTLEGRVVVAADGFKSWVRETVGIASTVTPYNEKGVVANFTTARPHFGTAFQWFREDGILAFLPLAGNAVSIVWSTPDAHADELIALEPPAFTARVGIASGERLGTMELVGKPAAFPLKLMRTARCVGPRLALIGDAAHAIHPLSGHGINLGYQDARVLADVLGKAPSHIDIGKERWLRRYQRIRAEEVATVQYTTHGLQRLFRPQNPLLAGIRNLGMNLTDTLPVVKSALARYAMGT